MQLGTDVVTNLRVGAFSRYYKMFVEQFGVTGMLSGGYQALRTNGPSTIGAGFKASGYYASLTPGMVFFPVSKLGISASIGSLGYNHLSNEYSESPGNSVPSGYKHSSSTFGANFGLNELQFGGTYYFGR
ncbi:hypothetical protein [Hymenobacter sp. B1770]|uniref:hypothetical protein n=1 Tax=Hymenobacter sp. B1770 TaxID=1718788 RepID=UPI003CF1E458